MTASLVITGFMGTGKSTVGRIIADKLGRSFIDTDHEVEKLLGRTIPELFSAQEEHLFRRVEQQIMSQLSVQDDLVIATGGGTLLTKSSLQPLRLQMLFCLTARPDTIAKRLMLFCHSETEPNNREGDRPLLANLNSSADLSNLLHDRQVSYQRIFHQITTDGLNPEQVADEIICRFQGSQKIRAEFSLIVRPEGLPSYPVYIKNGLMDKLCSVFTSIGLGPELVLVVDEELVNLGTHTYNNLRDKGYSVSIITLQSSEQNKCLACVENIYHQLSELSVSRNCTIIAISGGIVGDIAGFVAATYHRGLAFIQIPSTLLAMVDASVGGKTGVNLRLAKNVVGAFKHPRAVVIDPQLLNSLPTEQFNAGLAEVIKHGIIGDEKILQMLENDSYKLPELIYRSIKVKADIVAIDPFEEYQRMWLNFGHTFAHAFESASGHKITHGHAVAVGLLTAIRLSILLDLCSEDLFTRISNLLIKYQLPVRFPQLNHSTVMTALLTDKKRFGSTRYFVLTRGLGRIELVKNPDPVLLADALELLLT